ALQDRRDRRAAVRHGRLRGGSGEPLRRAVRRPGGVRRGGGLWAAPGRGAGGYPAGVCDRPPGRAGPRCARHRRVRVRAVPHRHRAARAARHLSLVRRVGGDHHGDLGARGRRFASRPSCSHPLVFSAMTARSEPQSVPQGRYLFTLALAALGVVYGDIGTSPLYAIRYSFSGPHGISVTPGNVLGVLSMVFWSLVIVVTIKYHIVIIRADNKGEGGVLALMAMVNGSRLARGLSPRRIMIVLGIFGSALLYADGALTPAISVLSAVEGLEVATPALASWVLPVTLVILVGLFLLQSRGTARIGAMFGPVMLVVTGGEALYADLGHFGHRAIQRAWFGIALPSLMLNYFGQGALLLRDASAAVNPFYHLAPSWALYPLIALATAATIIASQAVISG